MYCNFNPGTSHERDIFFRKVKDLADDKKFGVTTKDAGASRKFLIGEQSSLGKVVMRVQAKFYNNGTIPIQVYSVEVAQ